jgi:hypothetical protein
MALNNWFEDREGAVIVNFYHFESWLMVLIMAVGFTSFQAVAIVIGILAVRTLRRNSTMFSAKTYKLQMQFTVLVCVQVTMIFCIGIITF